MTVMAAGTATGGYLLAYAMPLKKIWLTGKQTGQGHRNSMPPPRNNSFSTDAAGATRTLTAPMTN